MTGIFAVLDDIAMLMDDAAVMTKVAAKKTAGVLGDDLAVGAEKASGFKASRELPVIWAITKGSAINKSIILPFAFILSYFASFLIVPILLAGGVYLAYEGVEKIIHTIFHRHSSINEKEADKSEAELLIIEKEKVSTAVKTDFILSIEIIMIALGTVSEQTLPMQIAVVSIVAVLATVGVYGIVALMVRLDDVGYKLIEISENKKGFIKNLFNNTGKTLVASLPIIIKSLAVIGTIAMLLVGGGMFVHNIHQVHEFLHILPDIISELVVGLVVGLISFGLVEVFTKLKSSLKLSKWLIFKA